MRKATLHWSLIFAAASLSCAAGQCVVTEDRFKDTVAGHFKIGATAVHLTIPLQLYDDEWLAVVVEMQAAANTPQLSIQSIAEIIPLRNGAVLETMTRRGQRPSFSILSASGERLCVWQPEVLPMYIRREPAPYDFLMGVQGRTFHRIAEPVIFLTTGTDPINTDEFRINGERMTVLAYTRDQMILRDPKPALGLRNIRAEHYDVNFRFIETRLLWKSRSVTRKDLEISILGLDHLTRPAYMTIKVRDPLTALTACGKRLIGDYSMIEITPSKIQDGTFRYSCPVELLGAEQEPAIDIEVVERAAPPRPLPTRRRIPRGPWPEEIPSRRGL